MSQNSGSGAGGTRASSGRPGSRTTPSPPRSVVVRSRADLAQVLRRWGHLLDGRTPLRVTLGPLRPRRSLEQNALLHSLIDQLALHLGYSPEELKDTLKALYGPSRRVVLLSGAAATVARSTSTYDKQEMAAMIEQVFKLAAETGCVLDEEVPDERQL